MSNKKHFLATRSSRLRIGFLPIYEMWKDQPATFTEHSLVIDGHPVMEDWESNYMQMLADIACSKAGIVLEVGFGMGISARFIQSHKIRKHIVIEANTDVFQRVKKFAQKSPKPVVPRLGFWQEVVPTLRAGSVSGILFDTYPLTQEEIHQNHFPFFEAAHRLLRKGGVLTYYSDEVNHYSPEHREALRAAGFTNIKKKMCHVNPPSTCKYWKSKTIVAPIITK